MNNLTIVILTKNEADNIIDCLDSLNGIGEILVVDSGSTDDTIQLAEAGGARTVYHAMDDDGFAGQRNFALSQVHTDWVFYIDADERLTAEAAAEIARCVSKGEHAVYSIVRHNVVFGQRMRHGAHAPDRCIRLFPVQGAHWEGEVHEGVHFSALLPQKTLQHTMLHYTYKSWQGYFDKFNRYTSLGAEKLAARGKKAGWAKLFLDPPFTFIKMYILKRGFLDGYLGFVMSVTAAMNVWVKYLKLQQLEQSHKVSYGRN